MQKITNGTRLLVTNAIDTTEQLTAYKASKTNEIISLSSTRKHLRYQLRSVRDEGKQAALKSEIADLSLKISSLRKEVVLCDDIATRSAEMKNKIRRAADEQKETQGKELNKHESFRRRR